MKGRIGIIGGSISGLAAAISLRNKGFSVTVFERSKSALQGRGAGIGVSASVLSSAIQNNLLASSIPQLPTTTRSFLTKDTSFPDETKPLISAQPFQMIALNWQDIYRQLKSKLPETFYHPGESVISVSQQPSCANLTTDKGSYTFDYLIGADGINSTLRTHLFPDIKPNYAEYIGWRGICDDPELIAQSTLDKQGGLYFFEGGHIVLYKIPDISYDTTGKELINWVLYEHCPGIPAENLLIDKDGKPHAFSIPPGMLSTKQIEHVKALAVEKLPSNIAAIIEKTQSPFAQGIYDLVVPSHVQGRFILLGDAAASLKPHVAAGAVKAIEGAIGLSEALDTAIEDQKLSLDKWNDAQQKNTQSLYTLSQRFGKALVTNSPDWKHMDETSTLQWWTDLMQGKTWYPTTQKKTSFWSQHPSENKGQEAQDSNLTTTPYSKTNN